MNPATTLDALPVDNAWPFDELIDEQAKVERAELFKILHDELKLDVTLFSHEPAKTADDLDEGVFAVACAARSLVGFRCRQRDDDCEHIVVVLACLALETNCHSASHHELCDCALSLWRSQPRQVMKEIMADGSLACKNLFVRAKKHGQLALVCARTSAAVNLKELTKVAGLNANKQTFRLADEKLLIENLRVTQGSVNPFAMRHAESNDKVQLWFERALLEADADQRLLFHPMTNNATIAISVRDLLKVFDHFGVKAQLFDCELEA